MTKCKLFCNYFIKQKRCNSWFALFCFKVLQRLFCRPLVLLCSWVFFPVHAQDYGLLICWYYWRFIISPTIWPHIFRPLHLSFLLTVSRLMTYIYIYICRTAPLTSRRCILYIYSMNIRTEYFKHAAHSPFFPLQNAVYFIKLPFLVPVLFTF
jgi:hypothetical protein